MPNFEDIEKDEAMVELESGKMNVPVHVVVSYVTPPPMGKDEPNASGNVAATKPPAPRLITHLSLMREDSPLLLDPSKPMRKKRSHCAARLWKSYQQSIADFPLITKSLTSAILTASGEMVSQQIVSFGTFDAKRMWEFFFLGLVLQAPITHYYFLLLDSKLPPTSYPWTWTTLVKLLIDQLLFSPSFLVAVFLFLDTLDGLGPRAMMLHLQRDYGMTLVTNWKLWVPAMLINMALVRPAYRVLYNNVIFFVWSIILAMLLSAPHVDSLSEI